MAGGGGVRLGVTRDVTCFPFPLSLTPPNAHVEKNLETLSTAVKQVPFGNEDVSKVKSLEKKQSSVFFSLRKINISV